MTPGQDINDIDHLDPPSRRFVWTFALVLFTVTGVFQFTYKYFDDVARRESGTLLRRAIEETTGAYAYGYLPARYLMEFGEDATGYSSLVVLITLYRYYRTTRQREVRTAQLERGLA